MHQSHRIIVALTLGALALGIPRWTERHPSRATHEEMTEDIAALEDQVHALRRSNGFLWLEIEALTNDPRATERRMREELLYVRSDEMVIVFADEEAHREN